MKETLLLWLLLGLLSACAGKHLRSSPPTVAPYDEKAPQYSTAESPAEPPPPYLDPNAPQASIEAQKNPVERPKIALVVGGAGVSSFALVGLLKRFHEEGIQLDFIVASGWPSVFALAYGYLRSVHDVEWFASRLQERDFKTLSSINILKSRDTEVRVPSLIENSLPKTDLTDTKIPIVIATTATSLDAGDTYDRGDWRPVLAHAMSFPGLYDAFPEIEEVKEINAIRAIEVDEAIRRRSGFILALDLYEDYFASEKLKKNRKEGIHFKRAYLSQLKRSLLQQSKEANLTSVITLHKAPTDLNARRLAILAGYREGAKLAKAIKKRLME